MSRSILLAAASRAVPLRVAPACLVLACLALAGCVGTPATVGPRPVALAGPGPMPPPRSERIPPRPRRPERLVWEPGHYLRDQVGYTWHPGHYAAQPAPPPRFVHGRWELRGAAWAWMPGRWV